MIFHCSHSVDFCGNKIAKHAAILRSELDVRCTKRREKNRRKKIITMIKVLLKLTPKTDYLTQRKQGWDREVPHCCLSNKISAHPAEIACSTNQTQGLG